VVTQRLTALAALAGQTVVAAVTTDAWGVARSRFARLLGRGDLTREQQAEGRLEETRQHLTEAAGSDLELERDSQVERWKSRFGDLLEEDDGLEAELRSLVENIQTQLPAGLVSTTDHGSTVEGDVRVSAASGGIAAGVIHGNVAPPNPYSAGPGFTGSIGPGSVAASPGGIAIGRVEYLRPGVTQQPVRLAPRPVLLVGREDLLAELDTRLARGDGQGPRVVVLSGLGGAGKTSVALEYAHRHLDELGVAWQFAAEDPAVLAAEFAELAAQLGARDLVDTRDPVASAHAALVAHPADWLLVFDNAPNRAAVERFLPPAGQGQVLITSRSALWPPGQMLDVPALSTGTAAAFLVSRTGDPDEQAALELAGELGGLPLALEQGAAYMVAAGQSLAGYLALFRQRRRDLLARGEPAGYDKTVATTWALAFGELEQSAPEATGLLRLLAFYAPQAIPLRLMLKTRPGLANEFTGEVAPVLVPLLEDELAADDAIAALRRYSLVTPAGDGAVSVQRLVQAVTLDQMPVELAQAWQHAAAAVIEAAIPGDPQQPDTWPDFAALLPHAQAALAADSDGMRRIAAYLGDSGSYVAARELYRGMVEARGLASGPEHPDTLTVRGNLAHWTGMAGDAADACNQYAVLLPVIERVLGSEHPETLAARANLAYWTGAAGNVIEARDQLMALLQTFFRVLSPEHPDTLAARRSLAYWTGMAGDAAAARGQFEGLLPLRERVSGLEHPDTLTARANLAHWTGMAGRAAEARGQFTALLPEFERVLGPEHPATLVARSSLARWTGQAGDAAGARDQYAALLPVTERVLGPDHPDTLATRRSLARWTGAVRDAAGARDQYAALLPATERVLGPDHPDTLATRRSLAYWSGQAGDLAGARDQYAALLPVVQRVLGPDHPDTLATRRSLAYWTRRTSVMTEI
jgi:hypothetical protein